MFLARTRSVTTCLTMRRTPASFHVTTCLIGGVNTCLHRHATTCLLSCRLRAFLSSKEDLQHMVFHEADERSSSSAPRRKARKRPPDVTEARSRAQRSKLETQAKARLRQAPLSEVPQEHSPQTSLQARRRAATTVTCLIDDYLQDHEGGNHSKKTLEWHHTALNLLQTFLEEERVWWLLRISVLKCGKK